MKDPNPYYKIIELSNKGKSIREIMKEVGLKSTSSVAYYLKMNQDPQQKRNQKTIAKIHYHEREIAKLKQHLTLNPLPTTFEEVYDD